MSTKLRLTGNMLLRGFWVVELCSAIWGLLIILMALLTSVQFEYYGYTQWPWFYQNQTAFTRFALAEMMIISICMIYSYRYLRKNILLALAIGLIPIAIIYYPMMIKTNI